jgi:hypothetical protein
MTYGKSVHIVREPVTNEILFFETLNNLLPFAFEIIFVVMVEPQTSNKRI